MSDRKANNVMRGPQYSSVAIVLHWAIAILILGQIAGGLYMHNLPNASVIKFDLYQLHKSFGLSILILSLVRFGWRLAHRPPAMPDSMAVWEKLAARTVHWGFYALIILTPLAGWAMVSVSPLDIPTKYFGFLPVPHLPLGQGEAAEDLFAEAHEYLAFAILFLLAIHVGAALKHHFWDNDHVFRAMAPARIGHWAGIAGIIGAMLMGAVIYGITPPINADHPARRSVSVVGENENGNWSVDYDASSLKFIGEEKGRRFEGGFSEFNAKILFYPDNLEASSIAVTVSTGSAETGDEIRDSTVPGNEWFDTKDHPTATFVSNSIRSTGSGEYEADGVLTIKEYEKPITLVFLLEFDENAVKATGGADLIRTDYGLGADDSWLDDEAVSLKVRVAFEIHATRAGD